MKRRRKNTLSYEAARPDEAPSSMREALIGSMWEKESFRHLAGQADARIEAVKNPATEFRGYMERLVTQLEVATDQKEMLRLLREACDFLGGLVSDERRNSYFVPDTVLQKLEITYGGDKQLARNEYQKLLSEKKAQFFQDMSFGLDYFAAAYEVIVEFEAWKIRQGYAIVPGKRADVGDSRNEVKTKTLPGPPSKMQPPEIPKAPGIPSVGQEVRRTPKRTVNTLPMITLRRPSDNTHESFDRSDLDSDHAIKAARIHTSSFVGRLFESGEDIGIDAPPSSSPRNERAGKVTEEAAFKNFRRTFLPLFSESIVAKISDTKNNFSQALHSIIKRACVHLGDVSGASSPFFQYADENLSEDTSIHTLAHEFARRMLEEQAKKVRPKYIQHVHSYLSDRIDAKKIVPFTSDELDREVAQTAKQTFHILHESFAKGGGQLGQFIWLYYYFLEENQDEAHAFYNELYDTVFDLFEYKKSRAAAVPTSERITYPEPAASAAVGLAHQVGTSGIYSVEQSESPMEAEPEPYTTTSDSPPPSIPPETLPYASYSTSVKGGTLPPPPPEIERPKPQPEAAPEIEITGEDDTVENYGFGDDERTTDIKLPDFRVESVQTQTTLQRPALPPKLEPQQSVILNLKDIAVSQRDIPTAPPSRLPSMPVMPRIPQAPHLPLFEEKDPSLNEQAEQKKQPKQSRWRKWVALGAAAVTALGAYVAFRSGSSATDSTESQNSYQTSPSNTPKTTPAPTPAPQTPETTKKNVDSPEKTAVVLSSANYDLGSAESTVSYEQAADAFEGGVDATPFMSKVHSAEWNEKQQKNAEVLLQLFDEGKFAGASAALIKKHEQILRDLAAQTEFNPWKFRLGFEKRHAGSDFQSSNLYGADGVYNLLLSFERIFKFSGNDVERLMENTEWLKLTVGEKANDRSARFARALEFKEQSQNTQKVPAAPGGADSDDQKGKTGQLHQQVQPDNGQSYDDAPEIEYTEIDVDLNDLLGDDAPEIEYAEIDIDPNELVEDDAPEIEVIELTDDDIEFADISTPEIEVREVVIDRFEMMAILNEEEMAEVDAGWDEIPAARKEEKPRGLDTSFMKSASALSDLHDTSEIDEGWDNTVPGVASSRVDTTDIDEGWDTIALAEDRISQRLDQITERAA